jgi:hypothetical protein
MSWEPVIFMGALLLWICSLRGLRRRWIGQKTKPPSAIAPAGVFKLFILFPLRRDGLVYDDYDYEI